MNRILIASLLAASAALASQARAGTGLAGDISIETQPFTSTRTVAEVRAELAQFKASGVDPWADEYNPVQQFHGDRTRADVQAEFMQSRDEVAAMNGEDSGSIYMASRAPSNAPRFLAGMRRLLAGDPSNAQ
jgi:hypothetical protein